MKNYLNFGILFLIICLIILGFYFKNQKKMELKSLKIGKTVLIVEEAKTNEEKSNGLSDREKLGEYSGMLFVFEKVGDYGVWMKNMKFPIDIAWLNAKKEIIYIEKNISPDTYPKVFYSPTESSFILETNAGFFEKEEIKIGDLAKF